MSNILLFGLGNIGRRYLEGILKVREVQEIHIIEKNDNSIVDLKKKYSKEIISKKIFLASSIDNLILKKFLITIVSTTAINRYKILFNIKKKLESSYFIIEKVLGQSEIELKKIKNLFSNHPKAWISSPRRSMVWYKNIREKIYKEKELNFSIEGYNWGMACNAIHFIDLVSWITGEKIVSIETDGLDKSWIKAKRDGFWEIMGDLNIIYSNKVSLKMKCNQDKSDKKNYIISIKNKNCYFEIDEQKSLAKFNKVKKINGIFSNLSDIVPEMITILIQTGNCEWTRLEDSIFSHQKFIRSLFAHWKKNKSSKLDTLPIT